MSNRITFSLHFYHIAVGICAYCALELMHKSFKSIQLNNFYHFLKLIIHSIYSFHDVDGFCCCYSWSFAISFMPEVKTLLVLKIWIRCEDTHTHICRNIEKKRKNQVINRFRLLTFALAKHERDNFNIEMLRTDWPSHNECNGKLVNSHDFRPRK